MKTIEAFIREINESDELQNEIKTIKDKDALVAFLKEQNIDVTVDQFA